MPDHGEFEDKAKEFAGEHPDQVDKGMEKAGDFADQKTGGRFGNQVQEGEQRAEDYLGTGGQDDQGGGQNQ